MIFIKCCIYLVFLFVRVFNDIVIWIKIIVSFFWFELGFNLSEFKVFIEFKLRMIVSWFCVKLSCFVVDKIDLVNIFFCFVIFFNVLCIIDFCFRGYWYIEFILFFYCFLDI